VLPTVLLCLVLILANCDLISSDSSKGKVTYQQHCESCHMADGEGLRKLIPPLSGADYLTTHREQLPCIIRYGMKGEIMVNGTMYNDSMPANFQLNEIQITNLVNYLLENLQDGKGKVTIEDTKEALNQCAEKSS